MRANAKLLLILASCLSTTGIASAHSDVLLRSDGAKTLVGGAVDLAMEEGGPFYDLETDVFEAVFLAPAVPTPPFGFDFERDEPGFYSAPGLPVGQDLPANADISLSLSAFTLPSGTDTTFYWDGAGDVDFQPISLAQPGVSFTTAPTPGSPFAATDGSGFVDDHPLFGLTGGAADGVYLISPTVTVDGLLESDPFYMVWLASSVLDDEDTAEALEEALELYEEGGPEPVVEGVNFAFFEEAVEYVESIPEPATIVTLLVAFGAAAVVRR